MPEINFTPFPILETERLLLRRVTEKDLPQLFRLRSNPEVMQHIGRPLATSIDDVREMLQRIDDGINKNEGINWAITLKPNDELLGVIGCWRLMKEHYRGEIGYTLHPAAQGKGIMHEAMHVLLDYCFRVLGLHSLEAHVRPLNTPSVKLLEKNHFVREALLKENYFQHGVFTDTAIYSLLSPYEHRG